MVFLPNLSWREDRDLGFVLTQSYAYDWASCKFHDYLVS